MADKTKPKGQSSNHEFTADDVASMPTGGIDLADSGGLGDALSKLKAGGASKEASKPTNSKTNSTNTSSDENDIKGAYDKLKSGGARKPAAKDKGTWQASKQTVQDQKANPQKEDGVVAQEARAKDKPSKAEPKSKSGDTANVKPEATATTAVPSQLVNNPLDTNPKSTGTGLSRLGSIKPTSRVKSYEEQGPKVTSEQMKVNFGEPGKPKNPLAADKSLMTKPAPTASTKPLTVQRTVEDAIRAAHAVGGAFDLNEVSIFPKTDERDVHARIKTVSGLVVETEGGNLDLLAPESAGDLKDLSLELEVKSMLEAAREMNWREIDIEGTPEFCEVAKRLASDVGVKVIASVVQEHEQSAAQEQENTQAPKQAVTQEQSNEAAAEQERPEQKSNVLPIKGYTNSP